MDQIKTGHLIRTLRMEKGLTQSQLADQINVTDKAVSKWECGKGCPDISLLSGLAAFFGVDMQALLSGRIEQKEGENGNMKKLKFYVCPDCGNVITAASEANISCCGKTIEALVPRKAEESERLSLEDVGGEWCVSSPHEMTKEHYISFVAYLSDSSVMIFKQYPEWDLQFMMPQYRIGRLVWYCSRCGLMYQDIRR